MTSSGWCHGDTLGGPRRCRELVFTLAHSPDVAVRFAPTTPSCVRALGLQISYCHVTIPDPQLAPLHTMVCLYAVNSRTRYAYATTHTVPTSTASSFATPRLLADTVCGEGGDPPARCRRLQPISSWRVSSIVRVSSIKTGSVNCAIAPPFRSLMGSTGNPDGISHMCMLSAGRGAGATPT